MLTALQLSVLYSLDKRFAFELPGPLLAAMCEEAWAPSRCSTCVVVFTAVGLAQGATGRCGLLRNAAMLVIGFRLAHGLFFPALPSHPKTDAGVQHTATYQAGWVPRGYLTNVMGHIHCSGGTSNSMQHCPQPSSSLPLSETNACCQPGKVCAWCCRMQPQYGVARTPDCEQHRNGLRLLVLSARYAALRSVNTEQP